MPPTGPGYCSPEGAVHGPREQILYVTCIAGDEKKPDYVAVVDVNPESPTFCQVLSRLVLPVQSPKDELHHFGWNTCSSCHHDASAKRDKLIFPCLNSDRIYIVDVSDQQNPKLYKTIEPEEMHKHGLGAPHTAHCLANGDIMISTMGNGPEQNAKGNFFILDGTNDFQVKGAWSGESSKFGYDFWYQLAFDVMISTQWGAPKAFRKGFSLDDVGNGLYGSDISIWSWKDKKITQNIELGPEGITPLEVRFMHNPNKPHAYIGCAVASTVFHVHKDGDKWAASKVITVPPKKVENWHMGLSDMPGVITDIIISMDDKYIYFSNWVHGDIRQYDITDPFAPKLTGQVWVGGSITKNGPVKVLSDSELKEQPDSLVVKGRKVDGGPQMLQLSLDGKRLYVTTSLFYPWDKQFYGEMVKTGACMLQIDVDTVNGGMKINPNFLIDFGKEPDGPVLAHEMRYPGGDCTSDIFLSKCH